MKCPSLTLPLQFITGHTTPLTDILRKENNSINREGGREGGREREGGTEGGREREGGRGREGEGGRVL